MSPYRRLSCLGRITYILQGSPHPSGVNGSHQRRVHGSWSFHQLRAFVEYKARLAGVPIVLVDPRNTSRTCPSCGHMDRANRFGELFHCQRCGYAGAADHIAAEKRALRLGGL
jgi:transposase